MPISRDSFESEARKCGIEKDVAVLVAVSAGVDSAVLCDLLHQSQFNFSIAHVNYGLRGIESERDETFVKDLAGKIGASFFLLNAKEKMSQVVSDNGVQQRARDIRYEWFEEICQSGNFQYVLTAHHRDDQAETIIHQFIRGGMIASLRGMKNVNGKICRPLLTFSKEEILQYANENNLNWNEDSTNHADKYTRNKIRHHIIPQLKEMNPRIVDSLFERAILFGQVEEILRQSLDSELGKISKSKNEIVVNDLKDHPQSNLLIWHWIEHSGFSPNQVAEVLNLIHAQKGAKIFSNDAEIWREADSLLLHPKSSSSEFDLTIDNLPFEIQLPYSVSIQHVSAEEIDFNQAPDSLFLSQKDLSFPLRIRTWKFGDDFQPFGMKGRKKISDFLMQEKISAASKQKILVLITGEEIVAVPGLRIADRFRISGKSAAAIRIDCKIPV